MTELSKYASQYRHGLHRSPEYIAWQAIIQRCTNKNNPGWKNYGGRGIAVCEAWRKDFVTFFKDVGPRPGKRFQIDRINNDGNYEPSNVRWTTRDVNLSNRRITRLITINGEQKTFKEWAAISGLTRSAINMRDRKGWSGARLLAKLR